jgi:NADH-quinone oxidoreductase subunit M
LPFIGWVLLAAAFAGCGLPGFANFAGEITVFFGAWSKYRLITIFACWGASMVGAIYMLRALRTLLHGPPVEKWSGLIDAPNAWRRAPFIMLLGSLLLFGCFPRLLTDKIQTSVEPIVARFAAAPPTQASDFLLPAGVIGSATGDAHMAADERVPTLLSTLRGSDERSGPQ